MKKILSILVVALVLLSCFSFSAFAIEEIELDEGENLAFTPYDTVTFSNDYKEMQIGVYSYTRFNTDRLNICHYLEINNKIILTDNQEKEIGSINLESGEYGEIITAYLNFNDGSTITANFLMNDYIKEYERMQTADSADLHIIFNSYWDLNEEEITVSGTPSRFKGEKTEIVINSDDFWVIESFPVYIKSLEYNFFVEEGYLINLDDEYYYIDYADFALDYYDFDYYDYKGSAYKITDLALIQEIEEAIDKYYADDYGIFFNDNFTQVVSKIFITLVFAVIPFAIFVLTLIFVIRSKTKYKKLYLTTCILSAAELITLAIILILV
jgi:hypothetical protein